MSTKIRNKENNFSIDHMKFSIINRVRCLTDYIGDKFDQQLLRNGSFVQWYIIVVHNQHIFKMLNTQNFILNTKFKDLIQLIFLFLKIAEN